MSFREDPGFARVAAHLERAGGAAFELYKGACFERRLATRIRARQAGSVSQYADLLDRDPDERRRLVHAFAVSVSEFFRNPTSWLRLGQLLGEGGLLHRSPLKAWSAGCATGEEAFSLALLFASRLPVDGGAWQVDGSDIDSEALAAATAAHYPSKAVRNASKVVGPVSALHLLASGADTVSVSPALRARVRFLVQDLTSLAAPVGPYDVIVCRNLLIYFGDDGQRKVMESVVGALRPGGLLLLGKTELAVRMPRVPLGVVDPRERIYRRTG